MNWKWVTGEMREMQSWKNSKFLCLNFRKKDLYYKSDVFCQFLIFFLRKFSEQLLRTSWLNEKLCLKPFFSPWLIYEKLFDLLSSIRVWEISFSHKIRLREEQKRILEPSTFLEHQKLKRIRRKVFYIPRSRSYFKFLDKIKNFRITVSRFLKFLTKIATIFGLSEFCSQDTNF